MDEIRSALTRLDADALVYLVPADLPKPGMAIIAPAGGDLAWMPLTNLTVTEDVDRYLAVLATRSRDLVPPRADDQVTGSIAALCDWAWRAAIGPLLDQYFAEQPRPDGREPRIVLIPMGDLARVPWQAARRGDGTYAVELAAFSQAVSARLLCENAASAPVALSSSGMVVADPDTGGAARELDAARLEAHAIRRAFYQGARYVGRRTNGSESPSGRGTADDVRHWLTAPGPAAGAMLHLACHGSFTTGLEDAKSCLLLAAGELVAEEILELMAAAPGRQVGLVVLAACNTGRSVHGYDEAYSLGTAFLAGGARSVLSTQWSIPDAQTPSLMYLFHHYCRQEHLPPWQALRKAQMWMLNPKRRAPERMPAELLLSVPDGEPAPLVSWAGFVHFGQ
jgi:CHAT domain-containing protein